MDLRGADLPLLVSLDALVTAKSVTGAARRLGLSQPAMSAQLARLRDLFDDPLLVGNARGMVPTRRAEELAARLRGPLAEIGRVMRDDAGFDPATSEATVRLVGSEHTNAVIGVPLLGRLACEAPQMRLALYAFQTARATEQFSENDIDIGILSMSFDLPGLFGEALFDDDLVVVRRRGDPADISLDAYCAARHVLVSTTGGSFTASVDEVLAGEGRSRIVAASVQSFSVALGMVAITDLLTTLPRHYAMRWRELVDIVELPIEVPRFGFQMMWPKRVDADPMHAWLRAQIRAVAAEVTG